MLGITFTAYICLLFFKLFGVSGVLCCQHKPASKVGFDGWCGGAPRELGVAIQLSFNGADRADPQCNIAAIPAVSWGPSVVAFNPLAAKFSYAGVQQQCARLTLCLCDVIVLCIWHDSRGAAWP